MEDLFSNLFSTCIYSSRFAGFNAVSVANNHFNDFGEVGSNFTVDVLKSAGINYFGVSYGPYNSLFTGTFY